MTDPSAMLLRMRGVEKSFGSTRALSGVSLEVRRGEVHALVGENGAGKSTLMKILAGALPRDAGEIDFDGSAFAPRDPQEARDRGVAMIYQELSIALHLSVEDNIMLGRETARLGFVERRRNRPRVERALALLDHPDIQPTRRVIDLSPAARQMVEIARALAFDAKLIVMDEPTSSLGARDVERLFEVIERLREQGVAVIYISHFLEEVRRVAERFTVLRDGQTITSGRLAEVTDRDLIGAMVGRTVEDLFPRSERSPGESVLSLSHLRGERMPLDASLELRRGEVVGVAGLVGAGRTETLRALFGLDRVAGGSITIGGDVDHGAPPRRRLAQGVGLLSEDRKSEGLALSRTIAENATLSRLDPFVRAGFVDVRARDQAARQLTTRLNVKCGDVALPISSLSGGNQQKVAVARLLHHDVDVLLLDEPTRGIDVGAKAEIYKQIGELAQRGKTVLFVSSYLPELMGVCDRIAVMRRGAIVGIRDVKDWTEHAILELATRTTEAS